MHSTNYNNVKKWYKLGMWDISKVSNAVKKNWITEEEFKEITGQDYEA